MAKMKLENLSTEELNKKKKQGKLILMILVGAALIVLIANGIIYFKNQPSFSWMNVGILLSLVPIFIGLYKGLKDIDGELKNRDEIESHN